ncbi:ABC transporter substrate-binding protein [Bosea sp. 685]|uniref:ABC transporter substrate-binding protein n=1 Tax=Bosea sp. 685 TaxID=3080057 RepID=UPI0028930C75|nr:ABC transporter substrate-binding protein [Bosea sp. 685]WNJ93141.1 ABC transporter substrate-binding protein [Bosea sp. 685]
MRGLVLGALLAGLSAGLAEAQPVAFEDLAGRPISLSAPASRIIALPIPAAPTLMALDRSPKRLLGMHPIVRAIARESLLARIFPGIAQVETNFVMPGATAFMPNVEAIAATRPDLVLQRGERGTDIIGPLINAGLTTALVIYGDEEISRRNIAMLGAAIGADARAEAIIGWRKAVAERLAPLRTPELRAKAPRILFLSRSAGRFVATGEESIMGYAISLAGGRNAADGLTGSKTASAEQMMIWDPDVILLNSAIPDLTPQTVLDDPILSGTRAAKDKRVYKIPTGAYRWEPPTQENPFLWLWLAALLHEPGPAIDLRHELREGFRDLYGFAASESDLDQVLRLDVNGSSRAYSRFARP